MLTPADAPLDTSDRCDAWPPNTDLLSKTHWKARPGSPTNGSAITALSNHRLTVTIGDACIARARSSVDASAGGRPAIVSGSANHGTAEMTAAGRHSSVPAATDVTRSRSMRMVAAAPVRTVPP